MILTIVTITKEASKGLARTLDSAAAFRSEAIEQLVIAHRDGAAGVRELLGKTSASARLLVQDGDGIADAFNAGLAEARGEWVWFLNSGDAVHELLEREWLLSLLTQTGAGVVTGALHFDGEEAPRPVPPPALQWPLLRCWLMHPATLVRREALRTAGGFSRRWKFAMDFDLWQRLLRRGVAVDVVSRPFARFDVTGLSESPRTAARVWAEESAIVRANTWHLLVAMARSGGRVAWRLLQAFLFLPAGRKRARSTSVQR